jgi:hypothetical protein
MTASRHPFLIVFCLILALFQIITAWQVLQLPVAVVAALSFPPVVQIGLSAGWALLFLFAAGRLYQQKPGADRLAGGLIVAFILYSLGRLVVFARADYDRARLPFLLVATVLLLALPVWRLLRPQRDAQSIE